MNFVKSPWNSLNFSTPTSPNNFSILNSILSTVLYPNSIKPTSPSKIPLASHSPNPIILFIGPDNASNCGAKSTNLTNNHPRRIFPRKFFIASIGFLTGDRLVTQSKASLTIPLSFLSSTFFLFCCSLLRLANSNLFLSNLVVFLRIV